jgi:hypothetical protein
MPHATLDLDAFKAKIDYHKAYIIIASFIKDKIANVNLVFWLWIFNFQFSYNKEKLGENNAQDGC